MQTINSPLDEAIYNQSPIYRVVRTQFLTLGGKFKPVKRGGKLWYGFGRSILELGTVFYTPFDQEIAKKLNQRRVPTKQKKFIGIEAGTALDVHHETVHQLLWFSAPQPNKISSSRILYLNFLESIAHSLDLLLSVELDSSVFGKSSQLGLIQVSRKSRRVVRNLFENGRNHNHLISLLIQSWFIYLSFGNRDQFSNILRSLGASKFQINLLWILVCEMPTDWIEYINPKWQLRNGEIALRLLRNSKCFKSKLNSLLLNREYQNFAVKFIYDLTRDSKTFNLEIP